MTETFSYRVYKWLFQKATRGRGGTQLQRLDSVDWDVVVILDACRADVLQKVATWPVETTVSPASCTPVWIDRASEHGLFDNGHILTGNPQYDNRADATGAAAIEHYWRTHWDDRLQTALPEPLLDRATELVREDTGRVIVHLQQPHWPYVARLDERWELAYDDLGPWSSENSDIVSLQVAMQRGYIDTSRAYQAYRAATESVWETLVPYLSRWLDQGARPVVTADHGETFGRIRDFGFYEHPCRCNIGTLTRVPWVDVPATFPDSTGTGDVEDRLEALGYA